MGIPFSCPGSDYDALDEGFETVIVRSISFNGDDVRTALQSVSFNGRDSEPTILKSLGSGKMIIEGSLSFKNREMEAMISIKAPSPSFKNKEINSPILRTDSIIEKNPSLPMLDSGSPKHEAALKLQKVYKSFRTRRKLADCAVLVEQRWWKLLDFVELKRSSVSFFHIEKHESAISRWSRARTRVAKVGKGLSKDDKAQKLALQHWLEAIDPRHRYGHNLHFYYVTWLRCESVQPFFYWLDIGEGKEVNLVEKCPRLKLQQQCIKYLGPIERKAYEVLVEDGKFHYKQSGKLLDTSDGPKGAKWIFVLSTSKILYVGQKKKGRFQHSSFLAGGATSAAGRLVVENGMLKAVWPHSGHYRPTEQNFQEFVSYLNEHNVDLTNVKKSPTDDDDESSSKDGDSIGLRSNSSALDLTQEINNNLEAEDTNVEDLMIQERTNSASKGNTNTEPLTPKPKLSLRLNQILSNLEIPKKDNLFEIPNCSEIAAESPLGGYETAEDSLELEEDEDFMGPKRNLFEEDKEEDEEELVPKESILQRINSKKGMTSYQLGKQLSCKWTTGAGPRIGCVRDFPSELQFRALEQVNLSPRSAGTRNTTGLSPKVSTPSTLWRGTHSNTRTNFR